MTYINIKQDKNQNKTELIRDLKLKYYINRDLNNRHMRKLLKELIRFGN